MKSLTITITLLFLTVSASAQSCPDENHHHAIDLGLPSGTLWACCNVDAWAPEKWGGYYSWGEIEIGDNMGWNIPADIDNIAGTQYDVAHIKWGGSWVMPSKEQFEELLNNCKLEWTKVNGLRGCKLTSKVNGNSIFMPATYSLSSSEKSVDCDCVYWSSSQAFDISLKRKYAWRLFIDEGFFSSGDVGVFEKKWSIALRPVGSSSSKTIKNSSATNLKDETQPSFPEGQQGLFQPSFPGGQQGLITWFSDNFNYPEEAEKLGIQGEVVISFIVEKDGSLSNISVLRSVHPLLDNEALRMVRKMPKWEPVKIEGIAVPVKLNFPITFKLRK